MSGRVRTAAAYEPLADNETLAEARARNVRDALSEDVGTGDWTALLVPTGPATARVPVREEAVLCGRDWFEACFRALDPAPQRSTGATTRAPTWPPTRRSARSAAMPARC